MQARGNVQRLVWNQVGGWMCIARQSCAAGGCDRQMSPAAIMRSRRVQLKGKKTMANDIIRLVKGKPIIGKCPDLFSHKSPSSRAGRAIQSLPLMSVRIDGVKFL